SSEGYKSKASCLNGIESVKKNAPDAEIVKA
ncbi:MAG: YegP family protein, partial [Clostridia bacterium]|nr:YegP family protein [Clostridia bacterium]